MTFGAPYWLWTLAALPLLAYLFVANEQRRQRLLGKIVASRLLAQLAGSVSPAKRRLRFAVQLLALAAVIVSLARPQLGYTWEQSKRTGRDVLIAMDTSKSMLSADVAPNRLTRAKLAAQDLVSQLKGDRAGILAFAGSAFLQAPLTVDYGAVIDAINDLDTNTIPLGGTNIASVIDEAAKAFGKGESDNRCLVLFTDGEELDADGVEAARRQAGNFRIFTVGVGTPEGSIIPVSSGDAGTEFVKDPEGQIVKSRLDENRLKQIAEATGGFYTHLQNGPADAKKIIEEGLGSVKERDIDVRLSRHPIERYQWPLGLGLLLLAASMLMNEKRRSPAVAKKAAKVLPAAALLLVLCLVMQSAGMAAPPNQGLELYNNRQYKESYDSFNGQLQRNPDSQALEFDSGAAAYKSGDYDKAIDAFARAIASPRIDVRGKSEYNLGNALCLRGVKQESKDAKLKDWNNSIQHYDEALKIDPNNEDAKYNRDVVKKLIEDLNKKPPESQQNQDKDQKKDQDKKQDQKNKQDQQNQQNKQDQKNQKQDKHDSGKGQQNQDQQQQQQQQQQNQNQQQQQQQNNQGSKGQDKQDSKDQNDSQKNQSQQGSKQDDKQDSSSKQQPTPDQDQQSQGKDQQKDQQGKSGQNQGQNQNQNQQPGQQNPSPDNGNGSPQNQGQGSQQPTPASGEPDKKLSGKIQEAPQQSREAQAAAREQPYAPGQEREMTPAEAARIVESEKGEEAKGVLIEHKGSAPVLKDW